MLYTKLINAVVFHTNRKFLLNGLLNGTNRWFYNVMSQLPPNLKTETARSLFRTALENYLETLYRYYKRAGLTSQPSSDFYDGNDETQEIVMIYLLKTLKTLCGDFYLAAILALWVELERKEGDYEIYVRICTEKECDSSTVEVNPFLLYNFVTSKFVVDEKAEQLHAAA